MDENELNSGRPEENTTEGGAGQDSSAPEAGQQSGQTDAGPGAGWQTGAGQNGNSGQNAFGQNGYGQNSYGQNGYGYGPNNGYGQNSGYGQNPNGYGQNPNGYGPYGYGPNGYGNYGTPYSANPGPHGKRQGNGPAIASMVCGIIALILFCTCINIPLAAAAIILGIIYLVNYEPVNRGFAITGLVTGILSIALFIAAGIIMFRSPVIRDIEHGHAPSQSELWDEYNDMIEEYYGHGD